MSEPSKPKPKESSLAQTCSMFFAIGGFIAYQALAPFLFGNPAEHGFSFTHMLGAAAVGGVSALIGYGIGNIIEKL